MAAGCGRWCRCWPRGGNTCSAPTSKRGTSGRSGGLGCARRAAGPSCLTRTTPSPLPTLPLFTLLFSPPLESVFLCLARKVWWSSRTLQALQTTPGMRRRYSWNALSECRCYATYKRHLMAPPLWSFCSSANLLYGSSSFFSSPCFSASLCFLSIWKKPLGYASVREHFARIHQELHNNKKNPSPSSSSLPAIPTAQETVVVGDRYLTDVLFGNLHGLLTVHTRLLTAEGEKPIVKLIRRWEEAYVQHVLEERRQLKPPPHPLAERCPDLLLPEEEEEEVQ